MRSPVQFFLKQFDEINWFIVLVMSAIAGLGVVMMVSAGGGEWSPWANQQMIRFMAAFIVMLVIATMPMRWLLDYAYLIYFAAVIVLIVVDIIGHTGMGAQRWLRVGGLNLQPSEFTKLAVVIALARYFQSPT